jgi:hypothetical protein
MSITKGRHVVKEVAGVRCTIIEAKTTQERVDFLKALLEHNGLEVKVDEDKRKKEEDPITYTIGVADVIFNPVIAVYQRRLKTFDGRRVTPAYWNQQTEDTHPNYWRFGKGE